MQPLRQGGGVLCLLALVVLGPMGCEGPVEDKVAREAISGKVTFDGQPLEKGTIRFTPAGQGATASGGMVENGRFDIPQNEGPAPGKYKVEINAQDDAANRRGPDEEPGGRPRRSATKTKPEGLIPPRYNTSTELTAEVKPDVPNTFTFDLKK
jgi:hypothetical protein